MDGIEPKVAQRRAEGETPPAEIIVYVCPTEGCGNHYSSQRFRPDVSDIESMQYGRNQNDGVRKSTHPRIECPDCRVLRNIHVNRVPYIVTQVVPLDKALATAAAAENDKGAGVAL